MMKIHEYQAKSLLARYQIPIPRGRMVQSVEEALAARRELGLPAVVKAQIHAGGRGKGGGVKLARTDEELKSHAGQILGMTLMTHQTGPEGRVVRKLLIEEGLDIRKELYLGVVLDRATALPTVLCSSEGGVEIEKVAEESPEKIVRTGIDPATGVLPFHGRKLGYGIGLEPSLHKALGEFLIRLFQLYQTEDCSLVEINPLVVTGDGRLLALDAKINLDDSALHRHPDLAEMRDLTEEEPLEIAASKHDLNYIKLDGTVGCMVNGAGLAMSTMDIIKYYGAEPANFLDVGGGASVERVSAAFEILMSDPHVKAVLINIFGGIVRCDRVAQGVIEAYRKVGCTLPMVVRLEGTNAKEAAALLETSGIAFIVAKGLADAAQKAVAAAAGR
jgi:succinyl-CoA synthetase beta subunit